MRRLDFQRVMFIALLGAPMMAGCGGFDELDFRYNSVPPDNADINYQNVFVHEGIAVGVTALPLCGGETMDSDTRVELSSSNPGVLGVAFVQKPTDPDDVDGNDGHWDFVLYGVSTGSTSIRVRIDGESEGEIPVTVAAQ